MLNQGPHSKFLSGGGGGRLFLAPLFLLNYFLFNLFLFLQTPPPSPSLCAVPVNTLKGQRMESIVSEKLVKM